MNEAAILAARRNLKEISKEEISDALERIVAGPEKKGAVMTEQKKRLVAYHEVRLPDRALLFQIEHCSSPFPCKTQIVAAARGSGRSAVRRGMPLLHASHGYPPLSSLLVRRLWCMHLTAAGAHRQLRRL